jgi:hypothetical protein
MPAEEPAAATATAASRFIIRRFEAGDERAILELFARSFHAPRSIDHWRWKFEHDPWGGRRISLAFEPDGRLVAQYASYPVPVHHHQRGALLAHQIGDTMTDVSVRAIGRGPSSVLGRTAGHFYETFCREQVAFNYGFNVANIQKFSLRFLNSARVEDVPYRVRDLRRRPFAPMSRWSRLARGYTLELVSQTTAEWDSLFERVSVDYGFLVRRDARYVQWRYLECPGVESIVVAIRRWGRLVGWSVFRVRDSRLSWGDALFDRRAPEAVEVLLRHVVPIYAGRGIKTLDGWFPARPVWFDELLDRAGLERAPEPQGLSLMCVPFAMADAEDEMRARLYYTMGDSDLF